MGFLGFGKPFRQGEWSFYPDGSSKFIGYYDLPNGYFTITGTDNIDVQIPFPFQLNKIVLLSDDATVKKITIYCLIEKLKGAPYQPRYFEKEVDTTTDKVITLEENENDFDQNDTIRITIVGTANKKIYPIIYLRGKR